MYIETKEVVIVNSESLGKAYKNKYHETFDLYDLFFNFINGCYKEFDIYEALYEDEDEDEIDTTTVRAKVAQLLVENGIDPHTTVFIHIWW